MTSISKTKPTLEVVQEVSERFPDLHEQVTKLLGAKYDTHANDLSLLCSYFRIQSARIKPNK
jgi:hypothetical protein